MRLFPVSERESDVVLTPKWIFDRLGLVFDLDVAAALGGDVVPARKRYTIHDDGLDQPWEGRIWMNPPYSAPEPWVDRFIEHSHGICLVVLSRSYWQGRLWRSADAIVIPDKPISFDGRGFPFGVQFAAFGMDCVTAIGAFGLQRISINAREWYHPELF